MAYWNKTLVSLLFLSSFAPRATGISSLRGSVESPFTKEETNALGNRQLGEVLLQGFTLIDAAADMDLFEVSNGDTIYLSTLPTNSLNLRADVIDPSIIDRIVFDFDGQTKTESVSPYALGGDRGGNYHSLSWLSEQGKKTIKIKAFRKDSSLTEEQTISFTVTNTPPTLLQGFTLIDADTNTDLFEISNGATINLSELPTRNLNLRADPTDPSLTDRVVFRFDDQRRQEGKAPFCLGGDRAGDYYAESWLSIPGSKTLKVNLFMVDSLGREEVTLNFNVIEQSSSNLLKGFTLINADTNADLFEVSSGDTIRLSDLPTVNLNLRADVYDESIVSHVAFRFDDIIHSEGKAPFALGGDRVGDYKTLSWLSNPGTKSIVVKVFERDSSNKEETTLLFVVDDGAPTSAPGSQEVVVTGELRSWHKITLAFPNGPSTSETATPNPFTDYRLDVTFSKDSETFVVPGYYAADGNAAETSLDSGSVWHCHFAPPSAGTWSWSASFLAGSNVAQQWPGQASGNPVAPIHGLGGTLIVAQTNKSGRDLRGKGLLKYVGKHHLQFAETGDYFLKAGADSPENFLAYDDFDNTPNNKDLLKSWDPHGIDAEAGDPTWKNGKGSEILGAINYLSSKGMNAFSFLTMNINGDDKNVYMYRSTSDRTRIDVSKTAQWERVFEHADAKGMFLHFKTQEQENDQLLDGGTLGNERRLYYRELIARFGHHLALNWNLGEENTNTDSQRKEFSDYFKAVDPYDHIVVVHTRIADQESVYSGLYGYSSFDGASIQSRPNEVFQLSLDIVQASASSGKAWIVSNDEQGNARTGVLPDSVDRSHDVIRTNVLYANIMAGGAGVEYYFGYGYEHSDLTCEDWRSRDAMWDQSRYALEFFSRNSIPFWNMSNNNSRISNGNWLLMDPSGETIVVYLRTGGTADVDLSALGSPGLEASVQWYDPRTGGPLQNASVRSLEYGSSQTLGTAPSSPNKDWVILLKAI